jgi:hypothetical protein
MATAAEQIAQEKFSFTSSIAEDVWHQKLNPEAFEWWYFDALSEDGREAIVIIFLDNFIFSPRYNAKNSRKEKFLGRLKNKLLRRNGEHNYNLFPAIAFTYYCDGKVKYRAINEFAPEEFSASLEKAECTIGENLFRLETAPYGSGYLLSINAKLRKNRHLEAHFEWLSVESDFTPDKPINIQDSQNPKIRREGFLRRTNRQTYCRRYEKAQRFANARRFEKLPDEGTHADSRNISRL